MIFSCGLFRRMSCVQKVVFCGSVNYSRSFGPTGLKIRSFSSRTQRIECVFIVGASVFFPAAVGILFMIHGLQSWYKTYPRSCDITALTTLRHVVYILHVLQLELHPGNGACIQTYRTCVHIYIYIYIYSCIHMYTHTSSASTT